MAYVGVDFSLSALRHSHRKMIKGDFVCADAHYLPFKKGAADIILCSEVLEHIPGGSSQVLQEINDALKHNGKLLLTVPNRNHINIMYSLLRFNTGIGGQEYDDPPKPKELIKSLNSLGLQVEKHRSFCPYVLIGIIAGGIKTKMTPLVTALERNFRVFFRYFPLFPTQLYLFIQCRKVKR